MNGILNYNESQYIYNVNDNRLILTKTKEQNPHIALNDAFKFRDRTEEIPSFLIGIDFTTNKKIKFFINSLHTTTVHSYEFSFYSYLLF